MANGVSKMWRCQNVSVCKKLSLERRQKSYDGTHFSFPQKNGQIQKKCLEFSDWKVVKLSICKKEQGKNVTVKEEQGKEETS